MDGSRNDFAKSYFIAVIFDFMALEGVAEVPIALEAFTMGVAV